MLKTAQIKNFKSIKNIDLKLGSLTIVVGANSTGKSNCLESLRLFSWIVKMGTPPPMELFGDVIRESSDGILSFQNNFDLDGQKLVYEISLKQKNNSQSEFLKEKLLVGDVTVIDITKNAGQVKDENGGNPQKFKSKEGNLALKSAGDFGDKPYTSRFAESVKSWKIFDLDPYMMRKTKEDRRQSIRGYFPQSLRVDLEESNPSLDTDGEYLEDVLLYWYENEKEKFDVVSNEINECLGISISVIKQEEGDFLRIQEIDEQSIKLSGLSDGSLRIIAYHVLLLSDDLPSLIGIEEPERNLHPAILKTIANILRKLSKKTQVIITTHSPQLLDCFKFNQITDEDISILLVSKQYSCGTKVFQLNDLSDNREDLLEWMQDFGVGSAIYDSNLLEEILETK